MNFAMTIDNGIPVIVQFDRDLAVVDPERMAKRDQFVRALCRHHAGNYCRREHRSLGRANFTLGERLRDLCRKPNNCSRMRFTVARRLVAHVHHGRLIVFVNVAESGHFVTHRYDTFQLC